MSVANGLAGVLSFIMEMSTTLAQCTISSERGTAAWMERVIEHLSPEDTLVVLNKTDLLQDSQNSRAKERMSAEPDMVSLAVTLVLTGKMVMHSQGVYRLNILLVNPQSRRVNIVCCSI